MAGPWPLIHTEREALAGNLAQMTDEQWATPSLCAMTGRGAALSDLSGEGVATLRERGQPSGA
jgi:hypothetical protein